MGRPVDSDLSCSFCRKPGNAVAKLISSPSGYPRAYICDECVAVCSMTIADDPAPRDPGNDCQTEESHPLLSHPLASRLLASVERWMIRESLGADAVEDLGEVRTVANLMLADPGSAR